MTDLRELSITFDDAPRNNGRIMTAEARTQLILSELARHGAGEAMFFCNTSKLSENEGMKRLLSYANAGHRLANHTHRHLNFSLIDRDTMLNEIDHAHQILSELLGFSPYFRFPFSVEGKDIDDRNFLHTELAKKGYKLGYYTIDSMDWCMEEILEDELDKNAVLDYHQFVKECASVVLSNIEFGSNLARKILNREPRHILLLHENDITALFLGDLLAALKQRGWQIIPAIKALADPISHQIPQGLTTQDRLFGLATESQYTGAWKSLLSSKDAITNYFTRLKIIS